MTLGSHDHELLISEKDKVAYSSHGNQIQHKKVIIYVEPEEVSDTVCWPHHNDTHSEEYIVNNLTTCDFCTTKCNDHEIE